jgi:cell division protein FtsI/penicillin-binding protein 2
VIHRRFRKPGPSRTGPPRADEVLRFRRSPVLRHGGEAAESQRSARRVLWVGRVMICMVTVLLLSLLVRVAQLQTQPVAGVAELLDSQVSQGEIVARRAELFDRHGRPMAITRIAHRLFVDPALIADRNTFSEDVGYTLGYDPVWVERTIAARNQSRYVVLDQQLSDKRLTKFREMSLPGLATEPVPAREYPLGPLAGQLLGFVGRDGEGLDGLELAWDRRLRSEGGRYAFVRDHRRRPLWVQSASYTPQTDARAIRLSIDANIQSVAEQALGRTVDQYRAESGVMVVMDPMTGEVLAMANYPLFDPNHFADAPAEARRNRAVTDVFEPGSIFKPIVWAGITERRAMEPDQKVDCTTAGVWRTPYGRRLRDAHGIGTVTWEGVLIKSSNIGMAKGAEQITPKQLHEIVTRFGFGEATGSSLPGEIGGLVNPLDDWTRYSQSSIPMGQEIGVTGLQMVRAFSVLANGGYLVTPTIEALGLTPDASRPPAQRVLSPHVAALTRSVLRRTVVEGTGRRANSELYALFGKTGTAQLPDFEHGGYHQDRYVSSFIAGAPVDDPRLVIGCFVRNPDKKVGHYGGLVAAPAVMQVMEQSLQYLGVPTLDETPDPDRVVLSQ